MTRKTRPIAGLAAVALAAGLALAGCSAPAANDTPTSPAPADTSAAPAEPVTLEMSWWGDDNRAKLFAQVIDGFQAKYPNITVKQTPVGSPDDLFNRLATDFGAGGSTAPDVFALGGAKPQEYGAAGALLDMSTVKDIVQLDKYPEASLTSATVNGTVYGLPTGGNATAMFVNKDILDAAGVTLPSGDWTWTDLVTIANQVGSAGLKSADGKPVYGVDLRVQDILGTYIGQLNDTGVYDASGNVAATPDQLAKWYTIEKSMLDKKGIPDADTLAANWALTPDQQFYTLGQAAITFGYSNLAGTYSAAGTTLVMKPPTDTANSGVALLPSAFWAINAQSQHPTEAAELVNWFLNEPEAAKLILDTRGVQFNPDVANLVAPLLQGASADAAAYVAEAAASAAPAVPQPNGGARMNEYSQTAENNVLLGKQTPDEAGAWFVETLTADIKAAQ